MILMTADLETPGWYWSRFDGDTFVCLVEFDHGEPVCLQGNGRVPIPSNAEFIGPLEDPFSEERQP